MGFAVLRRSVFVAAMSRTNCGRADQSNATTPATCGDAIEVPLIVLVAVFEVCHADVIDEPGAYT